MQIVMKEQAESGKSELPAQILGVTPGPNGSALTMSPGTGLRTFSLDHVFPSTTTQADIFASTGLPTAWEFLNGTNGAVIVYGQTGSGKTHTMFGPPPPVQPAQRGLAGNVVRCPPCTMTVIQIF